MPDRARSELARRLEAHRAERWPELGELTLRFRSPFAYVEAEMPQGYTMPLFRLRWVGSLDLWGFAVYLASRDSYERSVLPNGRPTGSPELALDCACGLYLEDPTAWQPPFDSGERGVKRTGRGETPSPGSSYWSTAVRSGRAGSGVRSARWPAAVVYLLAAHMSDLLIHS